MVDRQKLRVPVVPLIQKSTLLEALLPLEVSMCVVPAFQEQVHLAVLLILGEEPMVDRLEAKVHVVPLFQGEVHLAVPQVLGEEPLVHGQKVKGLGIPLIGKVIQFEVHLFQEQQAYLNLQIRAWEAREVFQD
jgi:hypothetical protein